MNALGRLVTGARHAGEDFEAYRKRRRMAQRLIKAVGRGRPFYELKKDRHDKFIPYVKEVA